MARYGYNIRGLSDDWLQSSPSGDFAVDSQEMIPRGTRLSWSGIIEGDATSTEGLLYLGFSPGRQETLRKRLQGAGFSPEVVDFEFDSLGWTAGFYRILLTVVTPIAYARAEDAFSVLKGIVWDVYQNEPQYITQSIVNIPVTDTRTGKPIYSSAPAVGTPADAVNKNFGQCSWNDQTISEYFACQMGFSSTATALIVLFGALALIGIVALKK